MSHAASSSSTTTTPSPTTSSSTWASSAPRSRSSATTRPTVERAARARRRPPGRLARALHAGRGRDLGRGDPRLRRGRHAGARRLPRPPVAGRGLRRPRRPGEPIHGKDAEVEHDGRAIYAGLPSPLVAGRYHSLVADPDLPDELELSASLGDVVMGVRHRELPAEGVQFHPESVLTPQGKQLLANFLGAEGGRAMPNDILTRAIDAVCAGDHLTADHASAVLAEIMEGRASEVQTGAFLIALRAKGETVAELVGLARTMRSLAAPVETDRARPRRHRRAPAAAPRPSTSRPRRRWSPPAPAARSPSTATAPAPAGAAPPTCSRRSASTSSSTPSRSARCIDEVGFGFMFAPTPPRGDGARGPGPQGARRCGRSSTSSAR